MIAVKVVILPLLLACVSSDPKVFLVTTVSITASILSSVQYVYFKGSQSDTIKQTNKIISQS